MNSNFEDSINIGATDLIDVFSYLVARLEKMVNRRWIVLRTVFSLHKPEEIITAYYKENPHFSDTPADLIKFVNDKQISIEQLKSIILSHYDFGLHPPSWTKHVRVVGRSQSPEKREKGSCHEAAKKFCHRTQTPDY
jgi:hypothetical protein